VPELRDSIAIGVTVKRAFAYLADVDHIAEWMPNLVEAWRATEDDPGLDTEIGIVMSVAGHEHEGICRVVEWDEPRRLALESDLDDLGFSSTIAFDLAPDGRQQMTLSATVDYAMKGHGLGRLVGGLFGDRVARRDMRTALERLKANLETEKPRRSRSRSTSSR
jgi:uncharacterized protein YndB with AHSA1/START domain